MFLKISGAGQQLPGCPAPWLQTWFLILPDTLTPPQLLIYKHLFIVKLTNLSSVNLNRCTEKIAYWKQSNTHKWCRHMKFSLINYIETHQKVVVVSYFSEWRWQKQHYVILQIQLLIDTLLKLQKSVWHRLISVVSNDSANKYNNAKSNRAIRKPIVSEH